MANPDSGVSTTAQPGPPSRAGIASFFTPSVVLTAVLLVSLALRLHNLPSPTRTLIFDELYYVNAARMILGAPESSSAPYAHLALGRDPNQEHPALGKLLIAGSMAILGDNAFGWRIPSIIAGLASILILFSIVRSAGGDEWLATLAATIFSLDNLVLVHGRIATLDIFVVVFLLAAVWLYLERMPLFAGIAVALASLVKINGAYGLGALLLIELFYIGIQWRVAGNWDRKRLRTIAFLVVGFLPAWIVGLWVLDLLVGTYRTPWSHLAFMLSYGVNFAEGTVTYRSYPWQWLANEVQMPYLRQTAQIEVNGEVLGNRIVILFRGAMNPLVIGVAPLAVGLSAWRAWKQHDPLSVWVVAWVAATYLVYYPFALVAARSMFIYYMLPVMPAIAVSIAQFLRLSPLPRPALWGYLAAVVVVMAAYYPYQDIF